MRALVTRLVQDGQVGSSWEAALRQGSSGVSTAKGCLLQEAGASAAKAASSLSWLPACHPAPSHVGTPAHSPWWPLTRLQLDFANGGYVQHDEAAAHYVGMIDQTTRGHRCVVASHGAGSQRHCCLALQSLGWAGACMCCCMCMCFKRCSAMPTFRPAAQLPEAHVWRHPACGLADRPLWAFQHTGEGLRECRCS